MPTSNIRSYSDLQQFKTFDERYYYLRLTGVVGKSTFGFDRYLNQILYTSRLWKRARDLVIIRDDGCDLGIDGYPLYSRTIIHHMNPISIEDIKRGDASLIDPEFLICTSHKTHLAIHYGDESLLPQLPITRRSGDTTPWR